MARTTIREASLASERIYCFGNVDYKGFLITLDTTNGELFRVYSQTNITKVLHEGKSLLESFYYIDNLITWLEVPN